MNLNKLEACIFIVKDELLGDTAPSVALLKELEALALDIYILAGISNHQAKVTEQDVSKIKNVTTRINKLQALTGCCTTAVAAYKDLFD